MDDNEWFETLEEIHRAVLRFAEAEFESLTRRTIYRLQRFSASGIYGGDYAYKTLWDEWCHEVQEGPHDLLEAAWELTLDPILNDIIDSLPERKLILLSIYAEWELEDGYSWNEIAGRGTDSAVQLLRTRISGVAADRNLDRFLC